MMPSAIIVYEALRYEALSTYETSAWGLKRLEYEALKYEALSY